MCNKRLMIVAPLLVALSLSKASAQSCLTPSDSPLIFPSASPTCNPTPNPAACEGNTGPPFFMPFYAPMQPCGDDCYCPLSGLLKCCTEEGGCLRNTADLCAPTLSPSPAPTPAPPPPPPCFAVPTPNIVWPSASPICIDKPYICPIYVPPPGSPVDIQPVDCDTNICFCPDQFSTYKCCSSPGCIIDYSFTCPVPTPVPTPLPTALPTLYPSVAPTFPPTLHPSLAPSATPTQYPSLAPTPMPSNYPTLFPSATPTFWPTASPVVLSSPCVGGALQFTGAAKPDCSCTPDNAPCHVGSPCDDPSCLVIDSLYLGGITLGVTTTSRCLWVKYGGHVTSLVGAADDGVGDCVVVESGGQLDSTVDLKGGNNVFYIEGTVGNALVGGALQDVYVLGGSGKAHWVYGLGGEDLIDARAFTFTDGTKAVEADTGNDCVSLQSVSSSAAGTLNGGAGTDMCSSVSALTQIDCELPVCEPTVAPTLSPTSSPSWMPSSAPTALPTGHPTLFPSVSPTPLPSTFPSFAPTPLPSKFPSGAPTLLPTTHPSIAPTPVPSSFPSVSPTFSPTTSPTPFPSVAPTFHPTTFPSPLPTSFPSAFPTPHPSLAPTTYPSLAPSVSPITPESPTKSPQTPQPTRTPTFSPSIAPSSSPSLFPSLAPSFSPSGSPTTSPSRQPTSFPSLFPTLFPSRVPTSSPTRAPSSSPVVPGSPTASPNTPLPSDYPSIAPSGFPSPAPTALPSATPTLYPSAAPSPSPILAGSPTNSPQTPQPSSTPSSSPTVGSGGDTAAPSVSPTTFSITTLPPSLAPSEARNDSTNIATASTTAVGGDGGRGNDVETKVVFINTGSSGAGSDSNATLLTIIAVLLICVVVLCAVVVLVVLRKKRNQRAVNEVAVAGGGRELRSSVLRGSGSKAGSGRQSRRRSMALRGGGAGGVGGGDNRNNPLSMNSMGYGTNLSGGVYGASPRGDHEHYVFAPSQGSIRSAKESSSPRNKAQYVLVARLRGGGTGDLELMAQRHYAVKGAYGTEEELRAADVGAQYMNIPKGEPSAGEYGSGFLDGRPGAASGRDGGYGVSNSGGGDGNANDGESALGAANTMVIFPTYTRPCDALYGQPAPSYATINVAPSASFEGRPENAYGGNGGTAQPHYNVLPLTDAMARAKKQHRRKTRGAHASTGGGRSSDGSMVHYIPLRQGIGNSQYGQHGEGEGGGREGEAHETEYQRMKVDASAESYGTLKLN